jgi:hypothetical protein
MIVCALRQLGFIFRECIVIMHSIVTHFSGVHILKEPITCSPVYVIMYFGPPKGPTCIPVNESSLILHPLAGVFFIDKSLLHCMCGQDILIFKIYMYYDTKLHPILHRATILAKSGRVLSAIAHSVTAHNP